MTKQVTSFLSSELHTKIEINSVDIEFFSKVVLNGIYIEDLHQDTILYADKLKARISLFDLNKHQISIGMIELNQAVIALKRYKEDDDINIVKLLEQIKLSKDTTKTENPWKFNLRSIFLLDNTFSYQDLRYNDKTPCVDFDDVLVTRIFAHIEDIEMKGDSFFFNTKDISLREKSGFWVQHLSAKTKISSDEMRFTDLKIKTPGTDLAGELTFNYDHFSDFNHFLSKVNIKSRFQKTTLDSKDIAFFAKELIGLNKKIVFDGEIKGTVDNIKGRQMDIFCLNNTHFKGNVSLRGLPEVEETFIDLLVDELTTSKSDVEQIPAYPFNEPGNLIIPANLATLGKVKFKGKFTGFYNDFVAYGNLNTAIGFISSDINLKFDKNMDKSSYSGNFSTSAFDVGKFWSLEKYLGPVTCGIKLSGSGFKIDHVNAALEGKISDFLVNGYHYNNILVDGKVAKRLFSGALKIDEENVNLDFNGKVDFSKELPVFDFYAGVENAYLNHLNLSNRDTGSYLSCEANLNFIGNTIDNIAGNIVFKNINYVEKGIQYKYNKISLVSQSTDNQKSITLVSDIVDADVKGVFKLSSVFESCRQSLGKYIPALTVDNIKSIEGQSFDYAVNFKKTSGICDLFIPNLYIEDGTELKGYYSSGFDVFKINLLSDRITYKVLDFKGINVSGITELNHLKLESNIGELFIHDSLKFEEINLFGITNKDSANFSIVISKNDTLPNNLDLKCTARFDKEGKTDLHILPSVLKSDRKYWIVDPDNAMVYDSSGFNISNLNFTSGNENLNLSGIVSPDENDALVISLVNFNTESINKILKIFDIKLGGIANGITKFNAVTGNMKMEADLQVKNFSFFNDTLGDAFAIATWNTDKHVIDIDGHIDRKDFKNISVKGQYIFKPVDDSLAFSLTLSKFPVQTLNHYLKGVASDARGLLNADLNLYGTAKQPVLKGKGNFQKTSFLIDYLNTRYSFADEFVIDEKHVGFEKIKVYDSKGNVASVSGNIYHNHLKDFFFNIVIKAKNFECMNTSAAQNDIFYGHAFASGIVKINGDLDFISMDMSLKSEKGTVINLPLSNPVEVRNKEFINFVSHKDTTSHTNLLKDKFKVDLSGIEMSFDLEITPDADIKLIFDEKIGDVIIGRGSGNINMAIDPLGTFNVYGNYEIQSGNYLFTLQNLINKDFKIEKGGTLRWNGDPYDAQIDIKAVYKLNAVLNDLLQDTSSNNYKKRYPVELYLNLTEKLFNPKISFRIFIPNLDPTTESIVTRYVKTEEEINTQVFSLLLARRFSKPRDLQNVPNTTTSSNPVGENAAELLSSQVSQWISQISTDFDLGINYRPRNQFIKDEFEVMVSTNILNDRITIDGNVGVANNNQNSSNTNIVGDFNIEYKVSPDGRFRIKAFNKSNNNSLVNSSNSQYTQGIGVFYRREFDSWGDLLKKSNRKPRKKVALTEIKP